MINRNDPYGMGSYHYKDRDKNRFDLQLRGKSPNFMLAEKRYKGHVDLKRE